MVIKGAVVLITSAGSILGRNLAQHFAGMGGKIVVTDCDKALLKQTYAECIEAGYHVYPYPIPDYSQRSVDELFSFIESHFEQSVDVLINNWLNRLFLPLLAPLREKNLVLSFLTLPSLCIASATPVRSRCVSTTNMALS